MKVLFVVLDAGGNVPPALGIAAEVRRRGGDVTVLGHRGVRAQAEGAGLRFEPFTTAPDFDPRRRVSTLRGMAGFVALLTDRRIGHDALALVRREGIDVVVADTIATGGIAALADAGVPTLVLVHSFFAYFSGLARSPIGLLARLRGVDVDRTQARAAARIVTARPDLDPADALPEGVHQVGAVWQGAPVESVPAATPRVLVSLSTTAFPHQERTLQHILDALGRLPVEAVVTTGPTMDPAAFRVPANARIHAWLDHAQVLPGASLVIGHGGHSTAMRALSYGVPVLVIPSHPLLDQPMVGAALARAGVGVLGSRQDSPEKIAATVEGMLADAGMRTRAAAMGADIRAHDGAASAADLILQQRGSARPASSQRSRT